MMTTIATWSLPLPARVPKLEKRKGYEYSRLRDCFAEDLMPLRNASDDHHLDLDTVIENRRISKKLSLRHWKLQISARRNCRRTKRSKKKEWKMRTTLVDLPSSLISFSIAYLESAHPVIPTSYARTSSSQRQQSATRSSVSGPNSSFHLSSSVAFSFIRAEYNLDSVSGQRSSTVDNEFILLASERRQKSRKHGRSS
jgi:hypothetical protein